MMNIFTPVLTDFGLSKKKFENLNSIAGTTFYLAPEIENYKGKNPSVPYTKKVDIYAMGKTLIQILSENIFNRKLVCEYECKKYYNNIKKLLNPNVNQRGDIQYLISLSGKILYDAYYYNIEDAEYYMESEKQHLFNEPDQNLLEVEKNFKI